MSSNLFCVVSWHQDAKDLVFWDGDGWGFGDNAKFFETRKSARYLMARVPRPPDDGFLMPNVLDVDAFNKKFGRSLSPKPKPSSKVPTSPDPETGILSSTE